VSIQLVSDNEAQPQSRQPVTGNVFAPSTEGDDLRKAPPGLTADNMNDPLAVPALGPTSRSISIAVQMGMKRAFDLVVASSALVVLSPLFLIVSLAIRIDSKGSAFFTQERWGLRGKKIRIYKFRTMRADLADPAGVVQATRNDPRVTRLGQFLRQSNIDELPQLLNVVMGDMSLVGPRCHPIGMLAAGVPYEVLEPRYHLRHTVKPGITGLAQASGYRGSTEDPAAALGRIALDLHYIRNFSFWLDMRIIAQTVASEWRGGTGF